jgi:hypothetical protein
MEGARKLGYSLSADMTLLSDEDAINHLRVNSLAIVDRPGISGQGLSCHGRPCCGLGRWHQAERAHR